MRLVVPNPASELDAFGLKSQPFGSLLLVENPGGNRPDLYAPLPPIIITGSAGEPLGEEREDRR